MRRGAWTWTLLLALAAYSPAPLFAKKSKHIRLLSVNLTIKVAHCPDPKGRPRPVRSPAWVQAQLLAANLVLLTQGVLLVPRIQTFTPRRCDLLSRVQRHALASQVQMDGAATVLVLRRIQDLDLPSYDLMGVHWRYRGKDPQLAGRRWVFLTARARPPVLAHELCHYFGLPHDPGGGNLMTPGPSDPAWRGEVKPRPFTPLLSRSQGRRLRRNIRGFLRPAPLSSPPRSQ